MNLVRRRFSFNGFIGYVAPGFITAIIVIGLGFAFGSLGWLAYWKSANNENKLYAALRGEEWVGETALRNVKILREINSGHQYSEGEELKELLGFFSEEYSWAGLVASHWENVRLILDDSTLAEDISVDVNSWDTLFILTGFAGFLFLVVAMSASFAIQAYYERESILLYPWSNIWSYPFLAFMFPYVLISQPILLIRYAVWRLRGAREGQESKWRVRTSEAINRDRQKAKARIVQAKLNRDSNKTKWTEIYGQRLPLLRGEIEVRILSHKSRLAEIGFQVEPAQRGLAEEQANLKNLEKADWIEKDGGLEFKRLLGIAGVKACEVDREEIRVYTDTVFIRYMGIKYEIGDFLVRIGVGSNSYLKIENLCNTSNFEGRPHPYSYIGRDRVFCFGELQGHVNDFLGKRDYVPLIVVILQALQSADGDAPSRVMRWKRA